MKGKLLFLIAVLAVVFSAFNCGSGETARWERVPLEEARVLVVHSYDMSFSWTAMVHSGMTYVLEQEGIEYEEYFMDTKRNPSEEYKQESGQAALELVEEYEPHVVLTSDDNAQGYFASLLNNSDTAVVFCGVNGTPEAYEYDTADNVTGILERPKIKSSLSLLARVVPEFQSLSLVMDESTTSAALLDYFNSLDIPYQVDDVLRTNSFTEWQEFVQGVESDALFTYTYNTITEDGERVEPSSIIEWTINARTDLPTVGVLDFGVQDGLLIGNVESGFEHGEMAARMGIDILNGRAPSEMPITIAEQGLICVNQSTADILGVDVSGLLNITDVVFE
ncbi:MAG: ABC transporter substrate-binding protein [Spirochaetia bacterium]